MKIVYGDIWEYPADVVCITTNGSVKKNGELVMGRGMALQATERFPGLAAVAGSAVSEYGNHVIILDHYDKLLVTFPVKHRSREAADPELISQSATELDELARGFYSPLIIVLPRPGCGNGQLTWDVVRPLIEFLPDNVHVITRKETG
jgi:hypothetical protein